MQRPIKIPTLIGLLLVVVMVATVALLFERAGRLITRASPTIAPSQVEITNVTDTSFTVSWITPDPGSGAIVIEGPDRQKQTMFDERDRGKYLTHSVTIRNLKPSTQYRLRILSDGKQFLNNGKPYHITTGPTLSGAGSGLEPAFGMVLTADNQPADGALVYLTLEGSQKLSTLVKPSGSWLIPLNNARTANLTSYLLPSAERLSETLTVRLAGIEATAITDTLNDSPVPEMMLGKTYDFRGLQAQKSQQLTSQSPDVLGQSSTTPKTAVSITQPAQSAAFTTQLPLITGTGVPGKQVMLTIGIAQPLSGTTSVGSDGLWRFTPPKPLSPGKQSVTITTVDGSGKTVALTHTFEILKSGTQVLGEATPSATLTPTLETSPTPTSTLAGEPIPTSGFPLPLVILIALGLGLIASGSIVFVK